MHIEEEKMNEGMTKYHLRGPWPFHATYHRFTEPDHGDPHDHPWAFRSLIMQGGYVEEVFNLETGKSQRIRRHVGNCFEIPANHIHRLVELPAGECWTMIMPLEPSVQTSGFYQFRDGASFHKFWNEPEFKKVRDYGG